MRKYTKEQKVGLNIYDWKATLQLEGSTAAINRNHLHKMLESALRVEDSSNELTLHVADKGEELPINEKYHNALTSKGLIGIAVFSHTIAGNDYWKIVKMPNNENNLRILYSQQDIDKELPILVSYDLDTAYANPVELDKIMFRI